jgi:WD40 repeat protein
MDGELTCFRFINDGRQLAFTFDYNDLRVLWDVERRQAAASLNLAKINNESNYWNSIAVDREGRHILVGDDMVYEWIPAENSVKRFLATGERNRGQAACFSPDNALLAVITRSQIVVLDTNKQPVLQIRGEFDADSAAISPNNRWLAVSDDDDLVLYDIQTKSELTRIDHFSGPVVFSADSSRAFGAGGVPRLTLKTGEVDWPFNASDVAAVAVAPDLPILATADDEAAVKLWNYETGALLLTLQGHEHEVTGVAVSPDGKTVASGDEEGFLCFWEISDDVLKLASKNSSKPEPVAAPASPDAWPSYPKTIETSHGVSIIVTPSKSVTRAEVLQALEEAISKVQEGADSDGSQE